MYFQEVIVIFSRGNCCIFRRFSQEATSQSQEPGAPPPASPTPSHPPPNTAPLPLLLPLHLLPLPSLQLQACHPSLEGSSYRLGEMAAIANTGQVIHTHTHTNKLLLTLSHKFTVELL